MTQEKADKIIKAVKDRIADLNKNRDFWAARGDTRKVAFYEGRIFEVARILKMLEG